MMHDRIGITLLDVIDLLPSKFRPVMLSRVLLLFSTRKAHKNYKSASFSSLTGIIKFMKADVKVREPRLAVAL